MINTRQAGRRNRGRNNGRPNNGNARGGGDNGNRIDNRARGNAPQLLEKYRNMARDAQLAGDRVNAEYYLQFADHYFRVLADNRARQEEQQARFRRNDEPFEDDGEGSFDDAAPAQDFGDGADPYDIDPMKPPMADRTGGNRHQDARGQGYAGRDRNGERDRDRDRNGDGGGNRNRRDRRPRGEDGYVAPAASDGMAERAGEVVENDPAPKFVAEEAAPRPRRGRPPRVAVAETDAGEGAGIDLAVLPPAISRADNDGSGDGDEPAPVRKRGRPRKAATEAAE